MRINKADQKAIAKKDIEDCRNELIRIGELKASSSCQNAIDYWKDKTNAYCPYCPAWFYCPVVMQYE